MNRFAINICIILMGLSVHAFAQSVTLEFRAARNKKAPGFTKMEIAGSDRTIHVHPTALLTNADLKLATVSEGKEIAPQIELVFTDKGKEAFAKATAANIGTPLAILIDGKLVSAPIIREKITGGKALITGPFSREEADRIVAGLKK